MESSTAAKLKSLHRQAFGDAKLRARQWSAAYSDYRAAVDSAPDRAEAHFRLGCVFLAMNHFSSAVREFKRAVFLDPVLIQTGDRLETIFGPDSQITRSSILNKVADWLRADIRAPDRLFLMGLVLHFEDDSRSRGVLEAAQRMANERSVFSDHITAFIKLPIEKSDSSPLKSDSFPLPPIPDSSEPSTQLPPLQPNPSVPATGSQPSAPQSAPSSSLPPPPVPTPEP